METENIVKGYHPARPSFLGKYDSGYYCDQANFLDAYLEFTNSLVETCFGFTHPLVARDESPG